jgi:outer membrane protein OmpA-like peptidoglycan-associated protein
MVCSAVLHGRCFRHKAGGFSASGGLLSALLPVLSALFFGSLLYGQTAAGMDELLDAGEITWAQACRFVLPASGALEEGVDAGAAFAAARERDWLPRRAAADRAVNLGGLSYLLVQAFELKKSILLTLFPGPRYAYRQLDYLRLIPGVRDPALKVSGERFLQILGGVLGYQGDGEIPAEWENLPDTAAMPAVIPAALPVEPAVEPAADTGQEQRELMAQEIRGELDARGVMDTTVRVVEEGVAISLSNIQFMPDDTALTEAERVKLMRIAVILERYPGRKLLVGGHTAQAGSPEGRLHISEQRAQGVADFLIYLDSRRPEEITVRGYGSERPLEDNNTTEGRAVNRRVEITILDE